jgi:hypothetical protein
MTESNDDDTVLGDVMIPHEQAIPDHRAHGKIPKHVNDENLQHRVEQERVEVGAEDYDPDEVPDAEA